MGDDLLLFDIDVPPAPDFSQENGPRDHTRPDTADSAAQLQLQGKGLFDLKDSRTAFHFLAHDWESLLISFKGCSHTMTINSTLVDQGSTCSGIGHRTSAVCGHNKSVMVPTALLHTMSPQTLMKYCLDQERLLHSSGGQQCEHNNSRNKLVVTVENILCKEPCMKKLACDHFCRRLCYEDCNAYPCEELLSVPKRFCNHTSTVKCSEQSVARDRCETLVVMREPAGCGHMVSVPCHRQFDVTYEELLDACTAPCTQASCKHQCEGTCRSCYQGRFHVRCKTQCTRILDCGHYCGSVCCPPYNCPPCQKPCEIYCEHGTCPKKCGERCDPCLKPCNWECKHLKCTKLCCEECDRQLCREPCENVLPCGCKCIGYCGEPCPPLCVNCNKESVSSILLTGKELDELGEEDRFVFLEHCKHTFEYTVLDRIMSISISTESTVRAKTCPLCRAGIWTCRPFIRKIVDTRQKVLDMRSRLYGNQDEIRSIQLECLYGLVLSEGCSYNNHRFNAFRLYLLDSFVKGDDNFISMPLNHMDQIHLMVVMYMRTEKQARELDILMTERFAEFPGVRRGYELYIEHVDRLFSSVMSRPLPLLVGEYLDLNRESDRITDMFSLLKYSREKFPAESSYYTLALDALLDPTAYTDRVRVEFHHRFRRHWIQFFTREKDPVIATLRYVEEMGIQELDIDWTGDVTT